MKITDDVYMLDSAVRSHVFLIKSQENILIDTALPGISKEIMRELKDLGAENIQHILLTHHDVDHIGNAELLQKQTGAILWASDEDIPFITGEKKRPGVKRMIQSIVRLKIPIVNGYPSDDFNGIKIIRAPGHTPGHVILLYHDVLFTGDLFKIINGEFKPMPSYMNWNQQEAAKSVALLKDLNFEWLCPSHGQPLRRNAVYERFISQY